MNRLKTYNIQYMNDITYKCSHLQNKLIFLSYKITQGIR